MTARGRESGSMLARVHLLTSAQAGPTQHHRPLTPALYATALVPPPCAMSSTSMHHLHHYTVLMCRSWLAPIVTTLQISQMGVGILVCSSVWHYKAQGAGISVRLFVFLAVVFVQGKDTSVLNMLVPMPRGVHVYREFFQLRCFANWGRVLFKKTVVCGLWCVWCVVCAGLPCDVHATNWLAGLLMYCHFEAPCYTPPAIATLTRSLSKRMLLYHIPCHVSSSIQNMVN